MIPIHIKKVTRNKMTPHDRYMNIFYTWLITSFKCCGMNLFDNNLAQKTIRTAILGMTALYVIFTGNTIFWNDFETQVQCLCMAGFAYQVNIQLNKLYFVK